MSVVKVGEHVWADFGDGKVMAHVVKGAHENNSGEVKYSVQAPNGVPHDLAYREPEDDDARGSGLTFWLV
jgi:hypothetical protein